MSDRKTIHLIKAKSVMLIMALSMLCFSGCANLETRTDTQPLFNHLPDLSIESACWYGSVKEDRFSGVGPCTYVVYGVAKIDKEFAQNIKEEYEWTNGDTDHIFGLLARLNTKDYLDKEQNYLYSKDFTEDRANSLDFDVSDSSENAMINFDILVSFENNSIVFYAEYMDF